MRMIQVAVTEEMKTWAWAKAQDLGELRNSMLKGKGDYAGYIGQRMVLDSVLATDDDCYNHDVLFRADKTIYERGEVKTKRCTSKPQPDYLGMVTVDSLIHQIPDAFIFCRLIKSFVFVFPYRFLPFSLRLSFWSLNLLFHRGLSRINNFFDFLLSPNLILY